VSEVGRRLCQFIDPLDALGSEEGSRRPLVILAFDESHILTDLPRDQGWSLFSELRRILQGIRSFAIFSLFLSTAGRFHLLSPERQLDPSSRVANGILPLDPITEISFDELAFRAVANSVMLDRVVQMDWISHLGRPLYAHLMYSFWK
jgi:hypothetical protein